MSKKIKKQIAGHHVDAKHAPRGGGGGRNGDPQRRAYEIAKRNPHLAPRKLAKMAGIPVADAKRISSEVQR